MEYSRTIISKSAKRKMTSFVGFPIEINGKTVIKKVERIKAGFFTEQVVYKIKGPKGKTISVTKHEASRRP